MLILSQYLQSTNAIYDSISVEANVTCNSQLIGHLNDATEVDYYLLKHDNANGTI